MTRYNQPRHPILVQYLSIIPYAKFEAALMVGLDVADGQHPASKATMPPGFERYQNGIDAMQELVANGVLGRDDLESFLVVVRMLEAAATVEVDAQVVPSGSTVAH
jgi:hypothetical protein